MIWLIWLVWFFDQAFKACQTAAPAAADALERLSPGGICGHETDGWNLCVAVFAFCVSPKWMQCITVNKHKIE